MKTLLGSSLLALGLLSIFAAFVCFRYKPVWRPDSIKGLIYWRENGKVKFIRDGPNQQWDCRYGTSPASDIFVFYDRALTTEEVKLVTDYINSVETKS